MLTKNDWKRKNSTIIVLKLNAVKKQNKTKCICTNEAKMLKLSVRVITFETKTQLTYFSFYFV